MACLGFESSYRPISVKMFRFRSENSFHRETFSPEEHGSDCFCECAAGRFESLPARLGASGVGKNYHRGINFLKSKKV